jgi:hypothetical protein
MRVTITVVDDDGRTLEGELDLAPVSGGRGRTSKTRKQPTPRSVPGVALDFGLPRRAFLKEHAGDSGPKKFAVLVAHIVGGKVGAETALDTVKSEWARNQGVLGGDFQTMYVTRSKENGYTDSAKRGSVVLRKDWRKALR